MRHSGVSRVSTDENEGVAHICRNLRRPTEALRKKRDFFSFFPLGNPASSSLFTMMPLGCEVGNEFRSSPAVPKHSL